MMHLNKKTPGGSCGYCAGKKEDPGSASWGIGSPRLSVLDYQIMMDIGWRRCGTYVYKYDLEMSCCQPYTIRLDVSEFQISKSQTKVLKKFNKWIIDGEFPEKTSNKDGLIVENDFKDAIDYQIKNIEAEEQKNTKIQKLAQICKKIEKMYFEDFKITESIFGIDLLLL